MTYKGPRCFLQGLVWAAPQIITLNKKRALPLAHRELLVMR